MSEEAVSDFEWRWWFDQSDIRWRACVMTVKRLNRYEVIQIWRLSSIENFVSERDDFIFNSFENFKPVKRFQNRSDVFDHNLPSTFALRVSCPSSYLPPLNTFQPKTKLDDAIMKSVIAQRKLHTITHKCNNIKRYFQSSQNAHGLTVVVFPMLFSVSDTHQIMWPQLESQFIILICKHITSMVCSRVSVKSYALNVSRCRLKHWVQCMWDAIPWSGKQVK